LLGDAIWAKEPRTENEIGAALKANAYHYSRGTVSGLLIQMLHKNELRRPTKKNNSWAYVIDRSKSPEHQEILVTA
jgi:predicted transcriptional regulator